MKQLKRAGLTAALLACMAAFSGCPLVNSFIIKVDNNAIDIVVKRIALRDFEGRETIVKSALPVTVGEGATLWVTVPVENAEGADLVRVVLESTDPEIPLHFTAQRQIEGGFTAGMRVSVTVDGSPVESISVDVEAEG